jgi:hypothetical protein
MIAIVLLGWANEGSAQTPGAVQEPQETGTVFFPQDQIFGPLLADPKEPRSFASFVRGTFPSLNDPTGKGTSIASVGLGDSFGLIRVGGPSAGEGLQLDVIGSIFAQFDFGAMSNDLINADYVIGLPLTVRRSGFSLRARIYHQSSHLGDEYLLRVDSVTRENFSFESVELLVSQDIGPVRGYVGGERIFRREPDTLPASLFHSGFEWRPGRALKARLVSGIDLKTTEMHDWSPAISARIGLEVGRRGSGPGRPVALLLEIYDGPSPYGQFFQDDISYVGVGLHFGL